MAKCKKCGCSHRISSETVQTIQPDCIDVCTNPICAEPDVLSLMTPLIYDEIGINLCATFPLGCSISTAYPTAASATVTIYDICYCYGDGNVCIDTIPGRPNCYQVTLANLKVSFVVNIYDASCRLLGTEYPTAVYLPPETSCLYDEDTNPSSVMLEIFAPYGPSYNKPATSCGTPTAALNYIGFLSSNNYTRQGINLFALPKLIDFDTMDGTITVGLTLILQSLYFAGYRVASAGKINTPKGSLMTPDDNDCLDFVAGGLLDMAIKPLELGPPACEECLKQECTTHSCSPCGSHTYSQIPKPDCACNAENTPPPSVKCSETGE